MGKSPGEPTAYGQPRSSQPAPLKPIRRQTVRDPRSPRCPGTEPLPGRHTAAVGPPPGPAGAPQPVILHVLHRPPRHVLGSRLLRARPRSPERAGKRAGGAKNKRTRGRAAPPPRANSTPRGAARDANGRGRRMTPRPTRPLSASRPAEAPRKAHTRPRPPRRPRRLGPPLAQPQGPRKRARRTSRHGEREAGGATGRYRKGRSAGAGGPCSPCPWRCPPSSRPAAAGGADGGAALRADAH